MSKEKNFKPPIVIDCEASGLEKESYPIEVGYTLSNGETFSYYIKPEPSWTYWDPKAQDIHGIKRETLFEIGLPAYEVALKLNSQLAGEIIYSDASDWENFWINVLFNSVGLERFFEIRSIQDLFIVRSGIPQHSGFYRKRKALFRDTPGIVQHRAGDDSKIIQKAFILSRNEMFSNLFGIK